MMMFMATASLDPTRAPEAWLGAQPVAITPMFNGEGCHPYAARADDGRHLGGEWPRNAARSA